MTPRRSRWSSTRGRRNSSPSEFPLRLTTGRSLDSYNTGVQSNGFTSPIRYGEALDINPADAESLGLADGERVRVSSPRGSVEMAVRFQPDIPVGLTFTTYHFPDLVDINKLTNDAWDRASGNLGVQGRRHPHRQARRADPGGRS